MRARRPPLEPLRERFLRLFDGDYETGIKPDEVNWVPGRDPEDRTRQICNGWRADNAVAAQVLVGAHRIPCGGFHEWTVDLLYSRYRRLSLDESFFPVMWDETGYRTPWLSELGER